MSSHLKDENLMWVDNFQTSVFPILFLFRTLIKYILNKADRMNQDDQIQLIKTTITLKKVTITVRFPCSISFALKHQNNIVEHKGIHELRKGECIINQSIEIELEIPFQRGKYDDKKISLLIYMVSVNGKIPAGSVTINPTERIIVDKRAPLEKCPDKNAEATYALSFEKVRTVKKLSDIHRKMVGNTFAASNIEGNEFFPGKSRIKHSASSNLFKMENDGLNKDDSFEELHRNETAMGGLNSSRLRDSKDMRYSTINNSQSGDKKSGVFGGKPPKSRLEQFGKKSVAGTIQRDPSQSRLSRASNQMHDSQSWANEAQKSKISRMENDKTNYIRQINRMKTSMVRVQSEQRLQLEDQINKVTTQKQNLEDEIQKLRERTKYQERRQKESTSAMKELREQLDKKKTKILQLDSSRHEIQSQANQKDRLINQLQNEKKKLLEQLEEEKAMQISSQKRLDLKENSYKEQLKKLNEKYTQSESERQKALFDYNNLLAQIETSEKRNQLSLREKEKLLTDEKNKLAKRLEQLTMEHNGLKESYSESKSLVAEYESFKKKANDQDREKEDRIRSLTQTNQSQASELRSLNQAKKSLKQEVQRLQNLFNEDKVNYKKKYTEIASDFANQKQRLEKLNIFNANMQSKLKETTDKLEKELKEKTMLSIKFEQAKKSLQKYIQDEETKERLAQTLSVQNMSQGQRLNEFKNRLESEKKKYEQMQTKYEEQVQYLIKSKQYIENESEELKWLLQKEVEKFETLNIKHRELNEQMIELNHQIIQLEEKQITHKEETEEKNNKILDLQQELSNTQAKLKSVSESMRKREEDYYNVEKKGNNYQQEITILKENLEKTNQSLTEQIDSLQKTLQNREIQLKSKDQELIILNEQLYTSKEEVQQLKQIINAKNNELITAKDVAKALTNDYSLLISRYDKLKEEERVKSQQLEHIEDNLHQKTSHLSSGLKELQQVKAQFEEYKISTKRAFEQLFQELSKEDIDKREIPMLLSFPDQNLSVLQMESIKKHNSLIIRYQDQLQDERNTIAYLEQELGKLQNHVDKREQDYIVTLQQEQEKFRAVIDTKTKQIQNQKSKNQELGDKIIELANEIDYLNSQINKYESRIDQLHEQISKGQYNYDQLKVHSTQLENQIFAFKQRDLKEKLMTRTTYDELKEIYKAEIERNKEAVNSLKQEIRAKEKIINDKMEELKKAAILEEQFKIQKMKLSEEIKELTSKWNEQSSNRGILEKQLKQRERTMKDAQDEIQSYRKSIDEHRARELALEQESKKLRAQINLQEDKYRNIKEEKSKKDQESIDSQKKEKEKREKIEAAKNKLEQENKQIRERCMRLESEIEFYKFYKEETSKKLEEYDKGREEYMLEMIRQKENVFKVQREISNFENKYYKLEIEVENLNKEKTNLIENNNAYKDKIHDLEERLSSYELQIVELQSKDKELEKMKEIIRQNEIQTEKNLSELRNTLAETRKDLSNKATRIKQLQKFNEDRTSDINFEKSKWEAAFAEERHELELKLSHQQENLVIMQEELEFQKQQAVKEIEGANGIIQELNEVIREKEDALQYKDEVINEQNVRLDELNSQLNECISKWEKEKESYLPTSGKMNEINEELTRMNKFIIELDGRNKQLLQINKRKMQQKVEVKPSITEMLKELLVLLQKNKNRILNRCQTDKEKEQVIQDFKGIQEKLDLTMKSTQIVAVKA